MPSVKHYGSSIAETSKPVRRLLVMLTLLAVLLVGGAIGTIVTQPEPIDVRWADYYQPSRVGLLAEDGSVTRDINADGYPIVYDELVHIVFSRCGPVDLVQAESQRTWVVFGDDDEPIQGFPGDSITIEIDPADCRTFELDYEIPSGVGEALVGGSTAQIRFQITPLNPELGAIVLETERFVLDNGSPPVQTEVCKAEQPCGNDEE